jgi:hypothetical protein
VVSALGRDSVGLAWGLDLWVMVLLAMVMAS